MKDAITFADVLITPKFSEIRSRKDVELTTVIGPHVFTLPIVSANMDTITNAKMAREMAKNGAQACLHRFCTIGENVETFKKASEGSITNPWVSIGLGSKEIERACELFNAGARVFVIDVAHGAAQAVVEQTKYLKEIVGNDGYIIVGNFAEGESVKTFIEFTGPIVDGIKVGIGPGSVCETRVKTGVGYPQLDAIMSVADALRNTGIKIIADGGMKTPGDISKALGAGAHICMIGSMLAGTTEAPGDIINQYTDKELKFTSSLMLEEAGIVFTGKYKHYRGSASKESYQVQGKEASWRTPEGVSVMVPYKGPVRDVLHDIEGGLRSAFSYTNSRTLEDFHKNVEFVRVSSNTVVENGSHINK